MSALKDWVILVASGALLVVVTTGIAVACLYGGWNLGVAPLFDRTLMSIWQSFGVVLMVGFLWVMLMFLVRSWVVVNGERRN